MSENRSNEKTGILPESHSNNSTGVALMALLHDSQKVFSELGPEFSAEEKHLNQLEYRLSSTSFHLAVLGQFKRGKSTLLNALIGEELLPSSVIPLTSVPTFLTWGKQYRVTVTFFDGHIVENTFTESGTASDFLSRYVTESKNPNNHLGVSQVDVLHPSSFLKKGVVLIDTPGIGSTYQHNTEATLHFLPQCDAALFMVSVDPPITETETAFLKAVREKVVRTVYLLNKMDYLSERDRLEAFEFFRTVLKKHIGLNEEEAVFGISAKLGLQARLSGDTRQWTDSGMAELENYLVKFLNEEKVSTLSLALAKKAGVVLDEGLFHLRLKQRSLTLPLDDLEKRMALFNDKLKELEKLGLRAGDILEGDRKRILALLETKCGEIRTKAFDFLSNEIENVVSETEAVKNIEKNVLARYKDVIPTFFESAMSETSDAIKTATDESLQAQQHAINGLNTSLRQTAAELFSMPYSPTENTTVFEMTEKPYWATEEWSLSISPIPRGTFERIMPKKIAVNRIRKWLQQDLDTLILRNAERMRWALYQKINDMFTHAKTDTDMQLTEIRQATLGAVQEAHKQRIERKDTVDEEVRRIVTFEERMQNIRKSLAGIEP